MIFYNTTIYFYAGEAFASITVLFRYADKSQVMFYFPEIKET